MRGEVVGRGRLGARLREPVEAALEGADDAVGVAGGQRGLPGEHPFCVEPGEHGDSLATRGVTRFASIGVADYAETFVSTAAGADQLWLSGVENGRRAK